MISIRKSTYRDEEGYLIVGRDTWDRRLRIFTPDRIKADKIAQLIRQSGFTEGVDKILME